MDSKPIRLERVSADSATTMVRQPVKAEEPVADSKSIKQEAVDSAAASDSGTIIESESEEEDGTLIKLEPTDAVPIRPIDTQPSQRRRNTKSARISAQRAAARILNAAAEIRARNAGAVARNLAAIAAARPREMRAAARAQRAAARDEAAAIAQPRRSSQACSFASRSA